MISELVETLLRSVQGTTVTEIEYQADGHRLRLVLQPQRGAPAAMPAAVIAPVAPVASEESPQTVVVRATMHGTFYCSPAPGEPPFAAAGQRIEVGQQLALLEAMKMLHAVESEYAGTLRQMLAENGTAVEPGTPLFEIDQGASSGV